MSPPRRRRRRGRKRGSGSTGSDPGAPQEPRRETVQQSAGPSGSSRRRRRRGRGGGGRGRTSSPKSSEDLVRALPKQRPETLTAPPDGQKLEDLIGELQSTWGVPQYPQEFRITIRVAAERDRSRGESKGPREQAPPKDGAPATDTAAPDAPRREKAPSPHRLSQNGGERSDPARPKRNRSRRRRRRSGGGGDKPSGPGGSPG